MEILEKVETARELIVVPSKSKWVINENGKVDVHPEDLDCIGHYISALQQIIAEEAGL